MTTFSTNLHDKDGDVFEECILIHHKGSIIKFSNVNELNVFISSLKKCSYEIQFGTPIKPDTNNNEPSCYCVDCGAPEFHAVTCRSYVYYKDEE